MDGQMKVGALLGIEGLAGFDTKGRFALLNSKISQGLFRKFER